MKLKLTFFLVFIFFVNNSHAYAFLKNNLTCDITQGQSLLNHGGAGFGPYNYLLKKDQKKFNTVISNHFSSNVQRLIRGQTTTIEGDLDFTLRGLPNYPPALYAMNRYYYRLKSTNVINSYSGFAQKNNFYTPDCYYKRALHFDNDNDSVNTLYAMYLHQHKRYEQSEQYYLKAKRIAPENPEIDYNLGLLYADMKKWDQVKVYAKNAYDKNYPLQGLKNKLLAYEESKVEQ
jgi:tetratricopeptide (TPR) repeat protein